MSIFNEDWIIFAIKLHFDLAKKVFKKSVKNYNIKRSPIKIS